MQKTSKQLIQGISWFLFSIFLDCTTDALTKHLTQQGVHFSIITFFRLAISILILLLYASTQSVKLFKTPHTKMHLLHGGLFFMASCLWTYGLKRNSMPIATLMSFSIPLFVLILAHIFLKERISSSLWVATFIGLLGIAIALCPVNQAGFSYHLSASSFLIAAILFATLDILNKYYVQKEPIFTMLFYSTLVGMCLSLPPLFQVWQTPSPAQCCCFVVLAVGGNLLLYSLLKAYQTVKVSTLAPLRYLEFMLSIAMSYYFFHELPSQNVLYGVLLIVPSVAYIIKQVNN